LEIGVQIRNHDLPAIQGGRQAGNQPAGRAAASNGAPMKKNPGIGF